MDEVVARPTEMPGRDARDRSGEQTERGETDRAARWWRHKRSRHGQFLQPMDLSCSRIRIDGELGGAGRCLYPGGVQEARTGTTDGWTRANSWRTKKFPGIELNLPDRGC